MSIRRRFWAPHRFHGHSNKLESAQWNFLSSVPIVTSDIWCRNMVNLKATMLSYCFNGILKHNLFLTVYKRMFKHVRFVPNQYYTYIFHKLFIIYVGIIYYTRLISFMAILSLGHLHWNLALVQYNNNVVTKNHIILFKGTSESHDSELGLIERKFVNHYTN